MSRSFPTAVWVDLCAPYDPVSEPGSPSNPLCGTDPHPPATATLLQTADVTVLQAIFGGYAHSGHMVDGNDNAGGKHKHRVHVVWSPGTAYAVLHATRCGSGPVGVAQSDTQVSDAFVLPAAPDTTIAVTSTQRGPELYMSAGATVGQVSIVTTGEAKVASPDPSRYITVNAGVPVAAAVVELIEVKNVAGFCFQPREWATDLEAL